MNKRFSTLLATALVAGGLSSNVMAADIATTNLKDGQFIHLSTATGGTTYLTMDETGKFSKVDATTWAGNIDNLLGSLWQVKLNPHDSNAGKTYTYSFTNRLTGQLLSVKLQSNVAGGGRAAITGTPAVAAGEIATNEKGGNTDWAYEAGKGFYVVDGDSIFTIGTNAANGTLTFAAAKATTAPSNSTMYLGDVSTAAVTLTAKDFNALVAKEGKKLFFTGENVSTGEKNVLTENTWTAVDAKIKSDGSQFQAAGSSVLYLTNGKVYENRQNLGMTAADATQKEYLLVDYNFYDPEKAFNVLKTDTIAAEPVVTDADFAARTKIAKHHPAAAAFTVTYYIPNDSMVIAPKFEQTSIAVATTLDAMHTALPTEGEINEVKTAVDALKTGVTLFSTQNKAADFPKDTKFAEVKKFAADGTAGSAKTGQDLIDAVNDAIKTVTYSTTAADKKKQEAYVAKVKAYVSALNGLTITKVSETTAAALVSTTAIKDGANYVDGLNNLTVATIDKQVVIRKLSSTKVLTIGETITSTDDLHGNLIATIKTTNKAATIGGDAEIAEGLYYVVDKEKGANEDSKTYGLYFDLSPVKAASSQYANKKQPFNPFAQFVVTKAAGVEKGNYIITNRADKDELFVGVTNVVDKDNMIFAIAGDTIQLVKADDVNAEDAYIGFKYISKADAINNKFTITSAADVLAGHSLVMRKDSSLAIAEADELVYTLVPSDDEEYGVEDALICKTYTIMNPDSAYLIKTAANQFVFSNGKYGKANGTPVQFYMIAVDTDSTYVLCDDEYKMVVSTQYKTISTEDIDYARNDMFIVKPEAAPASYKSLPKHVRLMGVDGNYVAMNTNKQGTAVREGDELKAAYSNLDFIFWLDTADYQGAETYKYYITKGVKGSEATEEAEAVADSRLFLYNAVDSIASKANKDFFTYGNNGTRAIFRTASVFAKDTLFVPTMDAAAKIDTVSVKAGTSADGLKHAVKAGIENFKFAFEYTDNEGEYLVKSGTKYVHNINGTLVMGDEKDALVVNVLNVTPEDEAATGNENATVNAVSIIARDGAIQIVNAQGKKVVITNILGQTIANTVLSSDNATIAAPAGVAVVAVEGEEAVKAIVK